MLLRCYKLLLFTLHKRYKMSRKSLKIETYNFMGVPQPF